MGCPLGRAPLRFVVGLAPEGEVSRRVAGRLDYREPAHLIALSEGSFDRVSTFRGQPVCDLHASGLSDSPSRPPDSTALTSASPHNRGNPSCWQIAWLAPM